jgi:4-hydroxy-3-methylbut-2-enyl diphosphate reductase
VVTASGAAPGLSVEKLLVAGLRGFCAGVVRAIDVVERALEVCDGKVYVRKEIIHNRYVVDELRAKGAIFVEEVDEVPDSSWLIYSAHGVSPSVRDAARDKRLKTIDATCPLVTKVHLEAIQKCRHSNQEWPRHQGEELRALGNGGGLRRQRRGSGDAQKE